MSFIEFKEKLAAANKLCSKVLLPIIRISSHITSERVSAVSSFGLFALAFYGLWLTSIPETLVASFSEEVSGLKHEKRILLSQIEELKQQEFQAKETSTAILDENNDLKKIRAEYISNVSPTLIDGISSAIVKQYEAALQICDEAAQLEQLEAWIKRQSEIKKEKDELKFDKTWIRPDWRTSENLKKMSALIYEEIYSVPEAFKDDMNRARLRKWCRDCDKDDHFSIEEFYSKKVNQFIDQKSIPTGVETLRSINSIEQINLLPANDRESLKDFINTYVAKKAEIYKHRTQPSFGKNWNYVSASNEAEKVRGYLQKMSEDLPALQLELNAFFTTLAK